MMTRQKKRPALASKPGVKLITAIRYAALAILANIFAAPFWFFEQPRSRLADRIARERSAYGQ
jgi:hypothetical protein